MQRFISNLVQIIILCICSCCETIYYDFIWITLEDKYTRRGVQSIFLHTYLFYIMCTYWTWSVFCFLDTYITKYDLEVLWWICWVIVFLTVLFWLIDKLLKTKILKTIVIKRPSKLVIYLYKIVQKIPYSIIIINKRWNAHLNTRDRWVWSYKITPFNWKEILGIKDFHTEESLINYLKRNWVYIIKPLWESKNNDIILKSYLIKFPDNITFVYKMINDLLEK